MPNQEIGWKCVEDWGEKGTVRGHDGDVDLLLGSVVCFAVSDH